MSDQSPTTRFTGIFIPAEILEMDDLTLFEMILLSWIDALYCPKHGGCYASNEYLGTKIRNAQVNTVAKALTRLRALKLIEDVSFDGRTRVIRSLVNRLIDKAQSNAGLDKNPRGVGQKSNAGMDNYPSEVPPQPYIGDSKDYKKEEREEQAPPPLPQPSKKKKEVKPKEPMVSFGSHVELREGEYPKLCEELGKEYVDYYIKAINNYVPNNGPYKDYAATIRAWHLRDEGQGKLPALQKQKEASIPSEDRIVQNRAVCERIEAKLRHLFTPEVNFSVMKTQASLIDKLKDVRKTYTYAAIDNKQLKEILLRDLESSFSGARDILLNQGRNKDVNALIQDLEKQYTPQR